VSVLETLVLGEVCEVAGEGGKDVRISERGEGKLNTFLTDEIDDVESLRAMEVSGRLFKKIRPLSSTLLLGLISNSDSFVKQEFVLATSSREISLQLAGFVAVDTSGFSGAVTSFGLSVLVKFSSFGDFSFSLVEGGDEGM